MIIKKDNSKQNKTEHAVQSYAAGKTNKIAMLIEEMLMLSNAIAKQC